MNPLFFLIVFSQAAFAGDPVPRDIVPRDLISRVKKVYQATPVLEAKFIQRTTVEVLEKEIVERGELVLERPGKFVIHYQGPHERRYTSDGKSLWLWRKGGERERVPLTEAAQREALSFLTDLSEMERFFQVREVDATGLELIPKERGVSPFKKIRLLIDPHSGFVKGVTLFPKSGNLTRYEFSEIRLR